MKKLVVFCLICVFFVMITPNKIQVFAADNEQINFIYNNKIFSYQLEKNIKTSDIFEFNHTINKYNRFGSKQDRQNLLQHLLNIGIEIDIAVEYLFPNISKTIEQIDKNISIKTQNAEMKINSNSQRVFHIKKEIIGISVDKLKLFSNISQHYLNNKDLNIEVPTIKTFPTIKEADFFKHTNLRADFSTDISSSTADRKHNIKNALNTLNKVAIAPNEMFSFNKIVGKRTKENGYREAKIIVNNEFVEGLGGGVCQVSSTLYNAALLSGLEIVEANKHSKQVGYVKYGFDATVNFGSSDLRFRNNTNEKIIIITNYSSNQLRIRIYGESLNNTQFKLTNEIINITEPEELIEFDIENKYTDKVIYEDEFFYLKKANKGMEIKSYREKYQNNILVEKQLLRHDKFKVQNAVKIYGTKKRTENDAQISN